MDRVLWRLDKGRGFTQYSRKLSLLILTKTVAPNITAEGCTGFGLFRRTGLDPKLVFVESAERTIQLW
jgi:hypothetical protein